MLDVTERFVVDCHFYCRNHVLKTEQSLCSKVTVRLKFDNDVIIKLGCVVCLGNGPSLPGHNRRNGG